MIISNINTPALLNHELSEENNGIENTANQNQLFDENMKSINEQIKRRKFLGIGLLNSSLIVLRLKLN